MTQKYVIFLLAVLGHHTSGAWSCESLKEELINETLPEELKVFDEVDAIFYLGSQSTR